MRAWLVAGPAGSGKSTLGRALARATGAALLDLDTLTNPLLDALGPVLAPGSHWNDDRHRHVVRPARYRALLAVARDQVASGVDVVLAAPFTLELGGGEPWERLIDALQPARTCVVWLRADAALRQERLTSRGEARDTGRAAAHQEAPRVSHLAVDATLPTDDQLRLVLEWGR